MSEPETVPGAQAVIHVVAGFLADAHGRVLLAQRPEGKHLAGLWEFPGGKRERGESSQAALVRELHEELGIEAEAGDTLLAMPWDYGIKSLVLEVMQVPRWRGDPRSCEGQALRWILPAQVDRHELAPADRAVMRALLR